MIGKDERVEPRYVILSSEQDTFDAFIHWLNDSNIGFQEAEGGYRMQETGEFVVERSVIVNSDDLWQIALHGWIDNQESVLVLSDKDHLNNYKATLAFSNGNVEEIGRTKQVDKETALANEHGYTYREELGYFIVVDEAA